MGCKTCQKPKVNYRKGLWSPEEDQKLRDYILRYGHGCWSALPVKAGLQRNGKSCRLRWINYLRPGLKHGMFSREEEDTVINLHAKMGNKWSRIARHLPGRTDNEVKNYWNSYLKKRVEGAQAKCEADAPPADSDVRGSPSPSENGLELVGQPANSGSSQPVQSSSADDSSCLTVTEHVGAGAGAVTAVRPHAPVLPKVMFADWLDVDYGISSLVAPGLGAGVFDVSGRTPAQGLSHHGSMQVDGPCGAVDSLHHGLGDGGIFWEFDAAEDQMGVQGGGFSDLLSVSEFLGIN